MHLYYNPRIGYTREDPSFYQRFYQREARVTITIRFPHSLYVNR
jgi:hypothetical protein